MIAPKLTEAQRRVLRHLAGKASNDWTGFIGREVLSVRALEWRGLVQTRTFTQSNTTWCAITDAGRAALRGES